MSPGQISAHPSRGSWPWPHRELHRGPTDAQFRHTPHEDRGPGPIGSSTEGPQKLHFGIPLTRIVALAPCGALPKIPVAGPACVPRPNLVPPIAGIEALAPDGAPPKAHRSFMWARPSQGWWPWPHTELMRGPEGYTSPNPPRATCRGNPCRICQTPPPFGRRAPRGKTLVLFSAHTHTHRGERRGEFSASSGYWFCSFSRPPHREPPRLWGIRPNRFAVFIFDWPTPGQGRGRGNADAEGASSSSSS